VIKPYILIAEDDEDDQFLIKSAFNEIDSSINLIFANDGLELIKHFDKIKGDNVTLPSLLILDLNMPKKNGKEVLKDLIDKDFLGKFPIVIFSTTSNNSDKQYCKNLGVNDFFSKPSNYTGLLDVTKGFLELVRKEVSI
jgi:CheY-like chemotaxis protein